MEHLQLMNSRWFDEATSKEFEVAYLAYRSALNLLAQHALEKNVLRYRFRPKIHQLGHLVYQWRGRNPRLMSCFLDEDFVFRTKRLALQCHPVHVSRQVMMRYAMYIGLLFSGLVSR